MHRYFPANFAKFLRTSLLTEHLRWLLLEFHYSYKNIFGNKRVHSVLVPTKCYDKHFLMICRVTKVNYTNYRVDICRYVKDLLCQILREANAAEKLGGRPPMPFENKKKSPDLQNFVQLWVKLYTQNIDLRVSRRKSSELLPCGAYLFWNFNEMFI